MRVLFLLLSLAALSVQADQKNSDCPRIVSQSPYITRALAWLGLERCIVGVSRYDVIDLPRTGGVIDPDVDAIALLEPQLMITSNWTKEEAWKKTAPPGATALRVDGFRGMAGVERMLRDIGRTAGFEVAADHDSIRNFDPDKPGGDVAAWIGERKPDYLFALKNRRDEACTVAIAMPGIPILPLDGPLFTHPGPDLLKGLEQLRQTVQELRP